MVRLDAAVPDSWLGAGEDAAEELAHEDGMDLAQALERGLDAGDPAWEAAFLRALRFEAGWESSWVHRAGKDSPYLSLELLGRFPAPRRIRLYWEAVTSLNGLVPFDFRAEAAARLSREPGALEALRPEVAAAASRRAVRAVRSRLEMQLLAGDGIDHLFDIPQTLEERLALVEAAAAQGVAEQTGLLAGRLAGLLRVPAAPRPDAERSFESAEAAKRIEADLACPLASANDYLVPWNALVNLKGRHWTVAEILRIVSFSPEAKLPDRRVRRALLGFYRSVLRVSGRATIGLGAGVFHVEHGALAAPSYFYIGRGAVIGKGALVDGVGGFALESGGFVGGGFSPLLVHTHKHLKAPGDLAAKERKTILPCVFHAARGARVPMSHVGLLEMADFLGRSGPYPGVSALPINGWRP